jgi:hypothetical protein
VGGTPWAWRTGRVTQRVLRRSFNNKAWTFCKIGKRKSWLSVFFSSKASTVNTVTLVINAVELKAGVFLTDRHFHPNIMFGSKSEWSP